MSTITLCTVKAQGKEVLYSAFLELSRYCMFCLCLYFKDIVVANQKDQVLGTNSKKNFHYPLDGLWISLLEVESTI